MSWFPEQNGASCFDLLPVARSCFCTVGGRNPAPPKKPRKDDSPRKYQQKMVSHGFKVVQDFVHPQYHTHWMGLITPETDTFAGRPLGGERDADVTTSQSRGLPSLRNNHMAVGQNQWCHLGKVHTHFSLVLVGIGMSAAGTEF